MGGAYQNPSGSQDASTSSFVLTTSLLLLQTNLFLLLIMDNSSKRFELVNLTAMIMTDGLEDSSPFKVAAAFRAGSKVYH